MDALGALMRIQSATVSGIGPDMAILLLIIAALVIIGAWMNPGIAI